MIYSSCDKNTYNLQENEVGGKAYKLFRFARFAPPFFVLTSSFFSKFSFPLESEAKREIFSRLKKNTLYAVRSSCVGEDGDFSFAGVHSSFLFVTAEDMEEKIKLCYDSAYSKEACEYRAFHKIEGEPKMAVVVQEMVDADIAGVINTVNPSTDNPDETVISVMRGTAEELLSGTKDSSDYFVNGKKIKIKGEDILSKKMLKKVMMLCSRVMRQTNSFQDIEFAVKKNKLYFLQTRDIRAYAAYKNKQRTLTVDNANIIESFSGIVTPLTQSFAQEVYANVYRQTVREGGVGKKNLANLEPYFVNMLYVYEDRMYYNLNSWYTLTACLPGKSLVNMERMMGVKTSLSHKKMKFSFFDLLKIAINFLRRLTSIEKDSKKFLDDFYKIIYPLSFSDYGEMQNVDLVEKYEQIALSTLSGFVVPIVNDCGAMLSYGKLIKKAERAGLGEGEIGALLGKAGGVESTDGATFLQIIERYIYHEEIIEQDFLNLSENELISKYSADPLISEYLKRFGSRVPNELKLETVTYLEDALPFFAKLKKIVFTAVNTDAYKSTQSLRDVAANKDVLKLRGGLKKSVERVKFFIRNRERLRFTRTYTFSAVRRLFLKIGDNFYRDKLLENSRDIFFLNKDEIFNFIKGKNQYDFKELVKKRKLAFEENETKESCPRIAFYEGLPLKVRGASESFCGIPSGQGIVTAKVKRVDNPNDAVIDGEIILARHTDPGWIPLFVRCSGLIVEHGSILSHSAVVAREMGIPAVTGLEDALKLIPDGATVYLNGNTGEVKIIEEDV